MKNTTGTWEKVLQRNFPPFAWTGGAYYEFRGFDIGPLHWERGTEIQVKYKTQQSFMIQNPERYYISNINDVISSINSELEIAIDSYNNQIYDIVRIQPGTTLEDLNRYNELHKLMYVLMLIGFDVVVDIKEHISRTIPNQNEVLTTYLETPWKPTGVQRERDAIQVSKDAAALADEFGYLHQDYLGKPWTAEDYKKTIRENSVLQSHMDNVYDLGQHSEYEQWLITIFKKFLYMYEEGRNAMVRVTWAMKKNMESLGNNPETLLYMTADEVSEFAQGNAQLISDDVVINRKKAFALYFGNGNYYEFTGEEAVKKLIDDQDIGIFWENNHEDIASLKGSIAFKGTVTGKARLVFTQEDANQVEDGEILISPMTQVEFLSGIRKCVAIVTDEGGIICHAAIVAREFGKPCILATQKATKIFKNGDMVEVDAINGIVTKLS